VKSLLARRPSPAMIVALIALFVALGGVSYGFATGEIDSREIKNNDVRSRDIRNNEIRTRDLRNNEVRGIDIRNSTIQGRDIGLNTVTGEDVKEDTLQKVPSALLADTATSADSAKSVDSLTIVNKSMKRGDETVTLATNGPLTLLGACVGSLSSTNAGLQLKTSEDNTFVGAEGATAEPDLDASEDPWPVLGVGDPPGGDRDAVLALFHASAPSGPLYTGNVSLQADATSPTAGTCRFQGFVVPVG
jgi:hypothetical protein